MYEIWSNSDRAYIAKGTNLAELVDGINAELYGSEKLTVYRDDVYVYSGFLRDIPTHAR